ncbi:MAG: 3-oxoacyl-ACP reductase, partial [Sciscionella sp.]
MSDRYQQFATSGLGKLVVGRLGLPEPTPLRRYATGQALLPGAALLGGSEGGRLHAEISRVLSAAGAELAPDPPVIGTADSSHRGERYGALIFDASAITEPGELRGMYEFFHPVIRALAPSGRVLVLGTPPEETTTVAARIAARALEGFTRSVAKELKRGATAQLVYVSAGAESAIESTLRFLLSARSAYVDAQVLRVGTAEVPAVADWAQPLAGKTALVTGASRGIGAAIAEVFARDGARVVCLDVPAQGADLSRVANAVGGTTLQCDITAADAPERLTEFCDTRFSGVDIVVHNAGITRDKTLARMSESQWDSVLAVNLAAALAIN